MTTTMNTTRTFWGSYIVRNSHGAIISRGELYSTNGVFPEHAFMRIAARYSKNCSVKFLPGVRCGQAE